MNRSMLWIAACLLWPAVAMAQSWTATNPTDERYIDEPLRLKIDVPAEAKANELTVKADGRIVPFHLETIDGKRWVWVAASLKPGEQCKYTLERGGHRTEFAPNVTVTPGKQHITLDNGRIAVRVPTSTEGGDPPGPIASLRLSDGKWIGRSFWRTERAFTRLTTTIIGDGNAFAKVRLRYEFEGMAGVWGKTPCFAQVDVELAAGRSHAVLTESHEMDVDDFWEFEATHDFDARKALSQVHSGGAGRAPNRAMWPKDLEPLGYELEDLHRRYEQADPRVGNTLMWLLPRWSQAYEDGWFFAATDGNHAVGALVARAGQWYWPHVNRVEIRAKPGADYAGFRCPTWKGRRMWLLTAGPHKLFADVVGEDDRGRTRVLSQPVADYAYRYCFRPLNKILHEYITTWPGEKGVFYPRSINPLHHWRGWIAGSNRNGFPTDTKLKALCAYQVAIDPDMYGRYKLFWSPENPNFYTDFMRRPLGILGKLRGHPRYKELEAIAKEVRGEDRYWSITEPSRTGQECPGYFAYAMGIQSFHHKTAWPLGDGRRGMHPGGDTHPPYIFGGKLKTSVSQVKRYTSEDIVGFGVMLRNRPGTDRETYVAFKSGPNRMHYHGDQLSIHYCANATPLAVDHHASYIQRPGQEHMHNRVAFFTDDMPYANMDGYERTIAFKTSDVADITIGEVASDRLRYVRPLPPEDWDREHPQIRLEPELKYRRTVVLMKGQGEAQDYLVLRDQYDGPQVNAAWCLHVRAQDATHMDRMINFADGLNVFVAHPTQYDYKRHDWAHQVGQWEQTAGVRLETKGTSGQYITVLYPGKPRKVDRMTLKLPAGLGDEREDRRKKTTVIRDVPMTVLLDFEDGKLLPGVGIEAGKPFDRAAHVAEAKLDGDTLRLSVRMNALVRDRERFNAEYVIKLNRDGDKVTGSYTGKAGKIAREGELIGSVVKDVYSQLGRYTPVDLPAMEAIDGGVRVGDDTIVFAGGVDDEDATEYVRITRGRAAPITLTGADIDMNRFQGRIGLIVPDAGYVFGRIPDWLIRQRVPEGGYE